MQTPASSKFLERILLGCGILASLWFVAMNIIATLLYPGYSVYDQTVSELSAIDAPTRPLWVSLGIVYGFLMMAFGFGIFQNGGKGSALRTIGILLVIYGFTGLFWPPMHKREVLGAGGGTITDTLHIVFTVLTSLLMLLSMVLAVATFHQGFRLYTIFTIIVLLSFGLLTSRDAPKLDDNLPTPLMGIWERINIGAFLLWVIILAITLLGKKRSHKTFVASERTH